MLRCIFICSLLLIGCNSGQLVEMEGKDVRVANPPNMVQLDGNLFMDRSEITNLDWLEYLSWLTNVHGKQSDLVQAALPDTTVWRNNEGEIFTPLARNYLRHPSFHNYPVVGISYTQALAYSKWRSSRVAEQLLLRAGLMEANLLNGINGEFDLEKFAAGEIQGLVQSGSILVPEFRLPTAGELRLAMEKTYPDVGTSDLIDDEDLIERTNTADNEAASFTTAGLTKRGKKHISHLIGNVAEMTNEQGLALGGSWYHALEASLPDQQLHYKQASSWLGFRNVASWRRIDW